ncbi:PDZ domain (Also known as DHR or GLGF) [Seminavis robusta]|uniref:PDZ domain (Also known as DHR or GLGF) n=1 Tax=Seminavis robusta TaxID=568900 RepID=A0A9N8DBE5_9STRA|nr:PDZ domain (Also known as DHR or GLGF) [Seminavis robusta]|eukprot:Sro7_g006090.1 PDZ domain (Also known as DHR or GLGF) (1059) ;mRNA; r:147544-150815
MAESTPTPTPAPSVPAAAPAMGDSASLITATIHKQYGSDGGITLRSLGGKLIVSFVERGEHTAGLKRGMQVMTMNNVDCSMLSDVSAQQLLNADEMVTFLCKEREGARMPGTVVTCVLNKPTPTSSIGIGMKTVAGQVMISSISSTGLAFNSDLQVGMYIKSVNNFEFAGLNPNQASTLIAQAQNKLEIIAQFPGVAPKTNLISATVEIPEEEDEEVNVDADTTEAPEKKNLAGLELMTANNHTTGAPMVVIKSIDPDGPFFGSELRVGMQISKVQNIDCTNPKVKAEQVNALIQDSAKPGENIALLAQDCFSARRAPGAFLTVIVTKPTINTKLGIVLASKANKLFIKKIASGTLGSTTELEPGMIVHSINNHAVTHKSSAEAAQILGAAEGHITFLVQIEGNALLDPSRLVTALMVKKHDSTKVGLAMKMQGGKIVITKNSESGLAKDTDLKVGMRVIRINNVDLTKKKATDAADLLVKATGVLTVIAQKPDLAPGTHVVASIPVPVVAPGEKPPSKGIKIKAIGDNYVVSGITEGGPASETDLQVGMLIKSLNNVDCASLKSLDKVLAMFTNATEKLNILACTPKGKPLNTSQLVTGSIDITEKTEVTEGALAYDSETGKITVTEGAAAGFLFGTALRAGMEILAINNVETNIFSKTGLETMIKGQGKLVFLAKRQELPRNLLITEIITKTEANTPLGIGIRSKSGRIYISSIKDGTLASTTKLLPGMELVSIDNEDCRNMDALVIAKLLRDAPVGNITIVASTKTGSITKHGNDNNISFVTALIEKGAVDNKVGLAFVRKRGQLVVTKITEGTATADTDLLVGMEVLSINNNDVTEMPSGEAAKLLSEAEGTITVLAKRPSLPAGSYLTAAIIKETPETSIGIKLAGTKQGNCIIKDVVPQSPASFTELEEGMVIRSINNVQTKGMPTKEVAELLKANVTSVTILCQTTKEVAMGRASFRSMRSLTSARSLTDDTIESSWSGEEKERMSKRGSIGDSTPFNLEDIQETPEEDVYKPSSPPTASKAVISSLAPETITIVTGGRRESFTVKNVVEC